MKLLIVSDIHGNWAALQAVLNAEGDRDQILCLGDLVDYGPEPAACVSWAMEECAKSIFIQGNHDWGVAWKRDPRSSPPFRHLAACTQEFTIKALPSRMRYFLGTLKPIRSFETVGKRLVACHAAPSEPLFHYLRTAEKDLKHEVAIAGSPDFLLFGHTHWPLLKKIGNTTIVNPGGLGQPKDGDSSAPYAVLEDGRVELRRISYPIDLTEAAYANIQLAPTDVEKLIAVLRSGGTLSPD
jgi:putative phosphoesterase